MLRFSFCALAVLRAQAFEWAQAHGIRILLCLHAAPGSQNGWEHSASRDGIPQWGCPGTSYVEETLDILLFLLKRYCKVHAS